MTIKQNGGIFGRNPTFNDLNVDGTLTSGSFSSSSLQVSGANENSLFYSDADGNLQTSSNLTWDTGALGALNVGTQAFVQSTSSTNTEIGGQYGKIKYYKSGSGIGALDFFCYAGGYVKRMELDKPGNLTLTDGNLVVSSGKGIDFSATSGTGTSELFDDYEEGSWTPTLTFATAGDVSVTYSNQTGTYVKVGRLVVLKCRVTASAFSHSTASGALRITGLPFSAANRTLTPIAFNGITKANYTTVSAQIDTSSSILTFSASGSGQSQSTVSASDVPTGGTPFLQFVIAYEN